MWEVDGRGESSLKMFAVDSKVFEGQDADGSGVRATEERFWWMVGLWA